MNHQKNKSEISDHLFNLKFAAKDLQRNAKKAEKEEKQEKEKTKKSIQKVIDIIENIRINAVAS